MQKNMVARSSGTGTTLTGTGTTLTGTGTSPLLPMGTGTTQSGTGTTSPLHSGYRYYLVPVPLTCFAQKMSDFSISHPFFFHKPPLTHPMSKIYHGIHPKQLQKWFRINETPFS